MAIELFYKIEGAIAIARYKGGVQKQVDMYARGGSVFIPHSGGFLRITAAFGGEYGTVNPDIKVLEFDAAGVKPSGKFGAPQYEGAPHIKAVS